MGTFKSFYILEFKRFTAWRNALFLILFFLLSIYLVHTGALQYKDISRNKEEFRKIERLKAETFSSYAQAGGYGIYLYFMPSSLRTLFYNSSLFSAELISHFDVGEKLNIYSSLKGKNIFAESKKIFFDFSGIILIFGSIIALVYGFDSFRRKEYLRFIASFYGHGRAFCFTWLSRIILLCSFFVMITTCALLVLKLHRLPLSASEFKHLFIFFLVMLLMLVFFFSIGAITGIINLKFTRFFILLMWVGSVFFIPAALNKMVDSKSDKITPNYQSELEKLTTLLVFEKQVKAQDDLYQNLLKSIGLKQLEKFDDLKNWITREKEKTQNKLETEKKIGMAKLQVLNGLEDWAFSPMELKWPEEVQAKISDLRLKSAEKMLKRYLDDELPKIYGVEKDLLKEMNENIGIYWNLYIIYPSAFYLAMSNEISSSGYKSMIKFYQYVQQMKAEFLEFYTVKRLEELKARKGGKSLKIESFIRFKEGKMGDKEANVFFGKSRLPGNFWTGIMVTIIYIVVGTFLSFVLYKRSLFSIPKERVPGLKELEIELEGGECHVVLSRSESINQHLFNVFSGKGKGFHGKVIINRVNIAVEKRKQDFVYLCSPGTFPRDIKAYDFFSFIRRSLNLSKENTRGLMVKLNLKRAARKSFIELEIKEKARIILETVLLKKSSIYMIYDFAKGMPADFLKEFIDRVEELKREGASILYLTDDIFLARKIGTYISALKKDSALMNINI
jgi:ABC-type Na+ transport system ATPase subunit NatA